jgi:TonB family protein
VGTADRRPLVLALLLSVFLHGALVAIVPGMKLPELVEQEEELVEVELREPQEQLQAEPKPLKQPEEVAPPEESVSEEAEPPEELPPLEAPNPPPVVDALDAEKLTSTLRRGLPTLAARPSKAVWLPTRRAQKFTAETITITPHRQSTAGFSSDVALKRADAPPAARGADMVAARAVAKKLLASLGGLPSKARVLVKAEKQSIKAPGAPEIGGEVGVKRTVVRHPPPPTVKIDHPVTVEMEFWVSPGGDVTRAHALRTGEAALDRAAARYVKGFKFNALDTGEIGQQRGTILVKFSWR